MLRAARVGVVLLALLAILVYVDSVSRAGVPGDASRGDLWFAIVLLGMIACVRGDALITLIRDAVMLALAALPAIALVVHVRVDGVHAHCSLLAPFLLVPLAVAVQVAIDLAMLRPVFAAVRARRPRPLPRARTRR